MSVTWECPACGTTYSSNRTAWSPWLMCTCQPYGTMMRRIVTDDGFTDCGDYGLRLVVPSWG